VGGSGKGKMKKLVGFIKELQEKTGGKDVFREEPPPDVLQGPAKVQEGERGKSQNWETGGGENRLAFKEGALGLTKITEWWN